MEIEEKWIFEKNAASRPKKTQLDKQTPLCYTRILHRLLTLKLGTNLLKALWLGANASVKNLMLKLKFTRVCDGTFVLICLVGIEDLSFQREMHEDLGGGEIWLRASQVAWSTVPKELMKGSLRFFVRGS